MIVSPLAEEAVDAASRPIFRTDDFEDIDEISNHGAYIGGMASAFEDTGIAGNYMLAAGSLVERALLDDTVHEVVLPALFLYRHGVELRLKCAVQPAKLDHDLEGLVRQLDVLLVARFGAGLPTALVERVVELARFDPRADAFRFTFKAGKRSPQPAHFPEEIWVDLAHLRSEMRWIDAVLMKAAVLLRTATTGP
jgi:hypothetical protein